MLAINCGNRPAGRAQMERGWLFWLKIAMIMWVRCESAPEHIDWPLLISVVTLLSILGSNSIAVPLSSSFPASELRYILDNSESLLLLSSDKFKSKADELLKEGLEKKPILSAIEKKAEGNQYSERIQLEELSNDQSGLMLYTSGTTSRPVSNVSYRFFD